MMGIKILSTLNEMLPQLNLVKQLSPQITLESYRQMIPDMINKNYKQAVFYDQEKPIAVCGFWISTKLYAGKYVELDNVVVDIEYRSKGIGEKLCNKVLDLAIDEGCQMAMLDAYLENEKGHVFYEREGFIKRGYHFVKKL